MKAENRIVDTKWGEFDAHHAKIVPKNFTLPELQNMQIWGHKRFYSWWNNIMRLIRGKMSAVVIGIYAHFLNLKWKRVEKRYLSRILRYKHPEEENPAEDKNVQLVTN